MNVRQAVKEVGDALFHGSLISARNGVRALAARKIPREQAGTLASFARIAGLSEISLRILGPLVRPRSQGATPPTDFEKVEYGAALIEIKARREGLQILGQVDLAKEPTVALIGSWVHFLQWNWIDTLPTLERYLVAPGLSESQRLGARVNLASAYIHSRADLKRAIVLLDEVLGATGPHQSRFHRVGALMARGQAEYFSGRPREALAYYEELERNYLDPNDGYNRIRILQWRAIARLSERRHGDQAMRDLIRARDLSRRQQRWEIVRSCELYRGEHLRDTPAGKRILTQLYFGSPYPRLRERLLARLGGFAELPAHYDRVCGKAGPKPPVLETRNGLSTAAHGAHLKEGQLLQRLLQALNMDYYSPLSVAEIHEAVFPGEYYNPDSSRDRVHQSLKRLRQWLATHRIPLTVAERDHLYVLEGAPACIVRETALAAGPTLRLQASVNQLHKAFGSVAFSSREVAQALGVSLRSANDCLREALDSGLVHQEGRGPACRYRVGTAT